MCIEVMQHLGCGMRCTVCDHYGIDSGRIPDMDPLRGVPIEHPSVV